MTRPDLNASVLELTVAVREQSAQSAKFAAQLIAQDKRGRRNRALIRMNILGLALGGVLLIAVALLAFTAIHAGNKASHATSLASQNRLTQVASCRASNDSRAQNHQLWQRIIDQAKQANPHPDPTAAKQIAAFQTLIDDAFAPRDCNKLGPNGAPTLTPPR